MSDPKVILDKDAIQRSLTRIAHEISEANTDGDGVGLIGIQRGGVHLADRLSDLLGGIWRCDVSVGLLDVSMHRDDISQRGIVRVQPTEVPFDVEGKTIVLVDDVLYTGRSVRAAIDALMNFGRPKNVEYLCLIDRRFSRELPIQADYIGKSIDSIDSEKVIVSWKEKDSSDSVIMINPEKNE